MAYQQFHSFGRQGFSLVELMLAIGLLMIIVSAATTINSRWYLQNNVEAVKNTTISFLKKAQSYAMSKKSNLTWGVCVSGTTLRMFGGTCGAPTIKDDYQIPVSVGISGLTTVTFSNLRGEPDNSQNISVGDSSKIFTISVNKMGGIGIE